MSKGQNNGQRRRQLRALSPGRSQRELKRAAPAFDPESEYRLTYTVEMPGGPLRSEYPSSIRGTLIASTEAELLRAVLTTFSDAYGFLRSLPASVGLISDMLGPLGVSMRKAIAMNLMTGRGLQLREAMSRTCPVCGVEAEDHFMYDEEGNVEKTTDVTAHDEECNYFKVADRPDPFPWKEEPAVYIDHPFKFMPVPTPQATEEISEEELQEEVQLPDAVTETEDRDGGSGEAEGE